MHTSKYQPTPVSPCMSNLDQPEAIRQPLSSPFWPLDDTHTVNRLEIRLVSDALQFRGIIQPVEIQMVQLEVASVVLLHKGKRGALHCPRNPQASSDTLG